MNKMYSSVDHRNTLCFNHHDANSVFVESKMKESRVATVTETKERKASIDGGDRVAWTLLYE